MQQRLDYFLCLIDSSICNLMSGVGILQNEGQRVEHISELLFSSKYFINATFGPSSLYSSVTDSIEFSVQP